MQNNDSKIVVRFVYKSDWVLFLEGKKDFPEMHSKEYAKTAFGDKYKEKMFRVIASIQLETEGV